MQGRDAIKIQKDNVITDFILDLQQAQVDKGLGALRENPTRSLQWWQPKEVAMWASGQWFERCYAACALMGARCKQQTLIVFQR